MYGCVLHDIGELVYEQVDVPSIKDDEVLIRIHAAGICGSDIDRVFTKGTYSFPTIIGHEFSGQVVEEGGIKKKGWKGKRVAVFPLIPCMQCDQCRQGLYQLCKRYNYYGSRTDGGFCEYQAIKKWNLVEISDSISYESAAMFEPAAVAVHALRSFSCVEDKNLLIYGVGTIGLLVAEMAKVFGVRNVIMVARNDKKVDYAKEHGILNVINSEKENIDDYIKRLTDNKGIEAIIEGCGSEDTINSALKNIAPSGEIVCLGNPRSDISIPRDVYWNILRKQAKMIGTWNSSYGDIKDDWSFVKKMIEDNIINIEKFITSKHRFEECNDVFDNIRNSSDGINVKSMFIN